MRAEEKQVDGPDLERAEEQKETLLAEGEESELGELTGEQVRDPERDRSADLLASIRLILEDKHLHVSHLGLPQREALALEALQSAVTGRKTHLGTFVYAEDRRSLLEQALAVLQPGLTGGAQQQLAAMSTDFQILSKQVGELRASLMNLEDGQDELFASDHRREEQTDTDSADKPTPKPSDPDAPRPATTLTGKGSDAKLERAPTTLTGPEVKPEPKTTTLSTGPEAKLERLPSTLAGPERKPDPEPATTLGDPAEIEQAATTKPRWKPTK
ncbi:MAG: hypothetical protein JWP01_2454 [Myxococcales bacterium]|nr:hypothetical protein [Myxococcales bacterium]